MSYVYKGNQIVRVFKIAVILGAPVMYREGM